MPSVPTEMNALLTSDFKATLVDATYGLPQTAFTGKYDYPVQQNAKYIAAAGSALMAGVVSYMI